MFYDYSNESLIIGVKFKLCRPLDFRIDMPKVDNNKTENLSQEQLARLLEAIETDENIQAKNFLKLLLYIGMRRGEVFQNQRTRRTSQRFSD